MTEVVLLPLLLIINIELAGIEVGQVEAGHCGYEDDKGHCPRGERVPNVMGMVAVVAP